MSTTRDSTHQTPGRGDKDKDGDTDEDVGVGERLESVPMTRMTAFLPGLVHIWLTLEKPTS